MCCVLKIYLVIALIFSAFYALKAYDIFTSKKLLENNTPTIIHQIWLNFLGSAVGWICLWFVAKTIITAPEPYKPDLHDIFMGFVAFAGVTGHLPSVVVSTMNSVAAFIKAFMDKYFKLQD